MSVASMTGFARAEGHSGASGWVWEARSVNGKGLDLRCRLPSGFDALEAPVREAALARFRRGNVTISLNVTRTEGRQRLRVNRDILDDVLALQVELGDRVDPAPPRIAELMAVRGIVELVEEDEDGAAVNARLVAMKESLGQVLDALAEARRGEGARLAGLLVGQLDEIAGLAEAAAAAAARRPEAVRAWLRERLDALLDAGAGLAEERLAQELAVLAVRADVQEEIDRLRAHLAAARELLDEGGAVGRRLDFLSQEFNREANTICSKAGDAELTRIGLGFKAVIDRFREQVQNVE